jgi:hypothetical protein
MASRRRCGMFGQAVPFCMAGDRASRSWGEAGALFLAISRRWAYYIILLDDQNGESSKPSDGPGAASFLITIMMMMVRAQSAGMKAGVDHLRLVMGTAMGGMHTGLWGENIPISWTR